MRKRYLALVESQNKITASKDVDFLTGAIDRGDVITLVVLMEEPQAVRVTEVDTYPTPQNENLIMFAVETSVGSLDVFITPDDLVLAG